MATPVSQVTVACALGAFLLAHVPLFIRGPALFELGKEKSADIGTVNLNPRAFQTQAAMAAATSPLANFIARGQAAHNNQLECLPWYYGSLIFALFAGVPQRTIDAVALTYVVARVPYIYFYLSGTSAWQGYGRSICWTTCITACITLFVWACIVAPKPTWT